ncbi:YnfC family lipoprotein [Ewingella americana]|uniref:YnfC family lipoprotein n=1 Tax=Ewingella americana TaxID=41202 RepID=A0A502G4G2_9GAMM|nr:YnfC family lipoprotein [Ewingella americana]TPG56798.1 YnfC family lipoprotein [Ewingella americana]
MKARVLLSLLFLAMSSNAAAFTQFKPAVLNAALLFEHDATTGNVKHSLQWIRDVYGKLEVMTEVRYDRSGCFTHINMVDKANDREFHLVNKDGVLTSFKGQRITGKINERCEITELDNEKGKYVLSYNVRGLLETIVDRDTGDVVERYEYHNSQFPVRISNYKNQKDKRIFYPFGSAQFLDSETVSKRGELTVRVKVSCAYTADGNADKCSLITSTNDNYHGSILIWISNHETEYF